MGKNIVTPWSFRDGKEYIVTVGVGDNPKNLSILISDKITAEEWSCNYDAKYVDENGNCVTGQSYREFNSEDWQLQALRYIHLNDKICYPEGKETKKSDAVTMDLMTYDDLSMLKRQKLRSEMVIRAQVCPPKSSYAHFTNLATEPKNDFTGDKKKYLIVTYVAEFDKVHYPIPLIYSGPPDPTLMQNIILRQQSEISQLRSANSHLEKKLSLIKTEKQSNSIVGSTRPPFTAHATENLETDECFSQPESNSNNSRRNDIIHSHSPTFTRDVRDAKTLKFMTECDSRKNASLQETLEKVLSVVHGFEERIVRERADHLEKMKRLEAENESLRDKLMTANTSERKLHVVIEKLERLLSRKDLKERSTYYTGYGGFKSAGARSSDDSSNNNVIVAPKRFRSHVKKLIGNEIDYQLNNIRQRSSDRKVSNNKEDSGGVATQLKQRSKYSSTESMRSVSKTSNNSRARSLSFGSKRKPFDPTAYVNEQKRKQENLAKLRLTRIEVRMKSRSRSRDKNKGDWYSSPLSSNKSTCSICDIEEHRQGNCRGDHENVGHALDRLANPNTKATKVGSCNTLGRERSYSTENIIGMNNPDLKIRGRNPVKKYTSNTFRGNAKDVTPLWKTSTKTTSNISNKHNTIHSRNDVTIPKRIPKPFEKYIETAQGDDRDTKQDSNTAQVLDIFSLEERLVALQNIVDNHQTYIGDRL